MTVILERMPLGTVGIEPDDYFGTKASATIWRMLRRSIHRSEQHSTQHRGSFYLYCMPKRFSFPKAERLKSRKQIDGLFADGKAVSVFPVRAVYKFSAAEEAGIKAGVSVSKRHFKKAVDRNRIKRLLREAYRLQKEDLVMKTKEAGLSGTVFFIYTDKTIADFETVKTAMSKCLHRLTKNL